MSVSEIMAKFGLTKKQARAVRHGQKNRKRKAQEEASVRRCASPKILDDEDEDEDEESIKGPIFEINRLLSH